MKPQEKKRLIWILIAIFFFFANLTVAVVFLLLFTGKPNQAVPATTQAVTQP